MSQFVTQLNSVSATWFSFLSHAAWQATLLAALMLILVRLRRRWPSPLRYWLLVLALAKFGLPPLLSMPTGLFSQIGPAVETEPPVVEFAPHRPVEPGLPISSAALEPATPTVSTGFSIGAVSPAPQQPVVERWASLSKVDAAAWLMLAYIAGAAIVAIGILRNLIALQATVRRATPVDDGELGQRFADLATRFGLRRVPRLLVSREPCGPAACGIFRPLVILPEEVASLGEGELDAVLSHELAHHRRRDPWVNWVQLLLTPLWWFNPVVWILNRQIRSVREDCCDDLLLTLQVSTGESYCQTLLSAASRVAGHGTAGVTLGFGDSLHPLARRFERIMDHTIRKVPRLPLTGMVALVALACLVLPGLRRTDGSPPGSANKEASSSAAQVDKNAKQKEQPASDPPGDVAPPAISEWPAGTEVKGRVLDHTGAPVANAEVLLLGEERVIVDSPQKTWFALEKKTSRPASARTDRDGAFRVTRNDGKSNRLGIIADDPLFWVISRENLGEADNVEIRLPASGSLAVSANFPRQPSKLPVMIELKSFDGKTWNVDNLRFHEHSHSLKNPGETVFEHLPPGHYSVQRYIHTKTGGNSSLMSGADRQLVQIEAAQRSSLRFERSGGQPLAGQVRGMEDVELRYAHLTISHLGPREVLGKEGKLNRMYVTFDVIPIGSDGKFTTEPMPPGKYTAALFAVRADTPKLSSQSADFSAYQSFTIPETGEPPPLEVIAKASRPQDLSQVTDLRVRVVDEEGKPVTKLQAMPHTAERGYGPWTPGGGGLVFLGSASQYRDVALQVAVRADGFASAVASYSADQHDSLSKGEATITLRRGKTVNLRFQTPEGMTWPAEAVPEVYFDDFQHRVRIMRQQSNRRSGVVSDFNFLNLRAVGSGTFEFQLAESTPPFHVAVHTPGFLQYFEAGPFTLADVSDGTLTIDLPRPAAIEAAFTPGDAKAGSLFQSASLNVMWRISGDSYLDVASSSDPSLASRLSLTDLAPGEYMVSVRTQPQDDVQKISGTEINPGAYFDRRMVTLEAGQSETMDFRATPYDPAAFRGTREAMIRIRKPDGQPAQGRSVSVRRFDGHYGSQPVFSGTVPESGEILLTGITDRKPPSASSRPVYYVAIGEESLGSFDFATRTEREMFDFTLPPIVGDFAPDVELTDLATGQATSLQAFRGKLVFLEFWATWCGPCQEPMAKLNALAREQKSAWGDRVALVPVSIDIDPDRVRQHLRQHDWTSTSHFWTGEAGKDDFQAPAARAFVVQGVPTAFLIDPDGRILWRGHPGEQDLKTRIDQILR